MKGPNTTSVLSSLPSTQTGMRGQYSSMPAFHSVEGYQAVIVGGPGNGFVEQINWESGQ